MILFPFAIEMLQQAQEIVAWQISETGQGIAIRSNEDVERPTRDTAHLFDKSDQALVEVGLEFAIHLDRDEVAVEKLGGFIILIALLLHHVTPVTGKVTNRHQHQPIAGTRFGKHVGLPAFPVDRIVGMQREVRRGVACQLIRRRCH